MFENVEEGPNSVPGRVYRIGEKNEKLGVGRGGCVVPVERYLVLRCHERITAARIFRSSTRRGRHGDQGINNQREPPSNMGEP